MDRVLVVQTWGVGDMVMTTPMLRALREGVPGTRVTVWAGSEAAGDVVRGSYLCDDVIVGPLRASALRKGVGVLLALRRKRFEAAIVCTRISRKAGIVLRVIAGIPRIAGDGVPPRPWGYTHWCPLNQSDHRVIANQKILRAAIPGLMPTPGPTYFHVDDVAEARAEALWSSWGWKGSAVLALHPGSGTGDGSDKRWPIERYRELARLVLNEVTTARVLFVIGPEDEDLRGDCAFRDPRVVVTERLPLRVVAGLLRRSKVLVTGDTGIGHVASTFGTPVVAIAGPTRIATTRPWTEPVLIVRTTEQLDCMPCYGTRLYGRCPIGRRCLHGVQASTVRDAVLKRLASQ